VAVISEYKNETMEYLLRLQAWQVRYWRWVNYAAESTNLTFPYTALMLSHDILVSHSQDLFTRPWASNSSPKPNLDRKS